jgi:hypothetical protein
MKPYNLLSLAAGILALAFTSATARGADSTRPEISFVVHTLREENVEGPDVERTYFTVGSQRIVFGQPRNCRLNLESGDLVVLLTGAGLDGEIRVSRSSFTSESDLAGEALKYRDAASASMPRDATTIEAQPPVLNPYPYNGWKSLGFTWTYSFSGRPMTKTVSYINLETGVQIVVTTVAAKKDAEKVGKIAREFMSSWWVMGAGA